MHPARSQGGLTYSKDVFDIERFERIREIAAEMLSLQSEIPIEKVKNLFCNETGFQTPKLDTRAAIFKDDKELADSRVYLKSNATRRIHRRIKK